jgi:hypothetical protein
MKSSLKSTVHGLLIRPLAAAVLFTPLAVLAQTSPPGPPVMARGVVTVMNNDTVTLKADDGNAQTVKLAKDWQVTVLKPVDVSAIQPGSFIGTAEMPQKDGTGRSLEVHVFPPGVKAGEGHYPWDTNQGSMMTNGTVGKVAASAKGRELQVSYPNGERKIVVPPGVPIQMITNGTREQVKPGVPASILVMKGPDGTMITNRIMIGENGAKPAM